MASLEHHQILEQGVEAWNQWREGHPEISKPALYEANLYFKDLRRANLRGANLHYANLRHADLSEADLRGADLRGVNLRRADLRGADLRGATLRRAILVETKLEGARFSDCEIYGMAVWSLVGIPKDQSNLKITQPDEPVITVDNLEVAQFIYLLLHNEKIRHVIETVTSKAVLILGRFTPERRAVLDAMREELLDNHDLVPILFDFEPSPKRDLTETIQLLANICRFVVADVTDAKSIPQELSHIIPYMPSVPVQPIILAAQTEYTMFEHWRNFNSVLPEFLYRDKRHLLDNLQACVIKPVERWEAEVKKAAAKERLLQERIKLTPYGRPRALARRTPSSRRCILGTQ